MEHAGPSVITQALPVFQDLDLRSGGQGGKIRESLHETLEIGDDGRHLGLLEHDL